MASTIERNHDLERENEELRSKRRKAEETVIELKAALKHSQSTVQKLTEENDALCTGQNELNMLRSHLDSAKSDMKEWKTKANQYKAVAELAKKREKEVKELQGQVKLLTSRLENHVKTATINEDNQAEIVQLRSQNDTLKVNIVELNVALESKKRQVEQLKLQLIQYKGKVKELKSQKEDLIVERNSLEIQLTFKNSITPRSLHKAKFEAGNLPFQPISEKTKLPLGIENKRLAERIPELEALEPLKGEMITIKSQNGVLEKQNLVVTKQNEELEQQIAELQEKLAKNQQNASEDVVELKVQLEKFNVEVERMREAEMKANTKLADMEELLRKSAAELEINEKALTKADAVIDEFNEMKKENERLRQYNEKLEIQPNTVTQSSEQENRLLTSAAYEQVVNRSAEDVMSMRVHDSRAKSFEVLKECDQALIEAQSEIAALRTEKDNLLKEVEHLTKALNSAQLDTYIRLETSDIRILERLNEQLRSKQRQAEERVLELKDALEHSQSIVQKLTEENDALFTRQNEFNMLRSHSDSAQSDVVQWRDTILVIDGKKVHVNKSILSYHSDYFRTLFSLNDKDKKLNEIPIEGIAVDDLDLLLGPISSKPVFPNDETVEKLLELATRFKMSFVIHHCEYYLLHISKIENERMMWIGEKYEMSELLEKAILEMDTMEKAKKWKQSPEYSQLSDNTKTRVFERLI